MNIVRSALIVAAKEFCHIRRDRFSLVLTIGLPVFQLILFGYALNLSTPEMPTVVRNLDGATQSRRLVRSFEASGMFRIIDYAETDDAVYQALRSGKAKVGIRIPKSFSTDVLSGRQALVSLWIDGSEAPTAVEAITAANAIVGHRVMEQVVAITNNSGELPLKVRAEILFNPQSRSANFLIPGLIGILVQMITTLMIAISVVRERERGTLNQIMLTPIGLRGLAAGKLLAYGAVGLIEGCILLALMRFVFYVPIHGSVPLLIGLLLVFLVPSVATGLLIAARAKRQAHALQLTYLIFLPSVLLSGYIFPTASMPGLMQSISRMLPATYFVAILRAVIVRGAGFSMIAPDLLALSLLSALLLSAAIWRFTKFS